MTLKERLSLARMRLRHCNYIAAAFVIALAGAWDEIKPVLSDFLSSFVSPQNLGIVLTGLSLLFMIVRVLVSMRAPHNDGDR